MTVLIIYPADSQHTTFGCCSSGSKLAPWTALQESRRYVSSCIISYFRHNIPTLALWILEANSKSSDKNLPRLMEPMEKEITTSFSERKDKPSHMSLTLEGSFKQEKL